MSTFISIRLNFRKFSMCTLDRAQSPEGEDMCVRVMADFTCNVSRSANAPAPWWCWYFLSLLVHISFRCTWNSDGGKRFGNPKLPERRSPFILKDISRTKVHPNALKNIFCVCVGSALFILPPNEFSVQPQEKERDHPDVHTPYLGLEDSFGSLEIFLTISQIFPSSCCWPWFVTWLARVIYLRDCSAQARFCTALLYTTVLCSAITQVTHASPHQSSSSKFTS